MIASFIYMFKTDVHNPAQALPYLAGLLSRGLFSNNTWSPLTGKDSIATVLKRHRKVRGYDI
jgi:hypothetical protein